MLYKPPQQSILTYYVGASHQFDVSPLLLLGQLELFSNNLMMKYTPEIGVGMSDWCLSERVLTRWWRLVAFMKAMDLIHRAMHEVQYRHTATAIKMVSKVDTYCIFVLFAVALAAAKALRSK